MKTNELRVVVALLACAGTMLPTTGWTVSPTQNVADLALQPGGLLVGQMFTVSGTPHVGQTVVVMYGGHEIVRTTTDENGVFAAAGLRGGQYEIVTAHNATSIRAWAPDTGPPSTKEGSLVVRGDEVIRGQLGGMPGSLIEWCRTHPWLCTITAITAIGVPLVIAEGNDNS